MAGGLERPPAFGLPGPRVALFARYTARLTTPTVVNHAAYADKGPKSAALPAQTASLPSQLAAPASRGGIFYK